MPITVEVGNDVLEFPDNMSPEEIEGIIKKQFADPAVPINDPAPQVQQQPEARNTNPSISDMLFNIDTYLPGTKESIATGVSEGVQAAEPVLKRIGQISAVPGAAAIAPFTDKVGFEDVAGLVTGDAPEEGLADILGRFEGFSKEDKASSPLGQASNLVRSLVGRKQLTGEDEAEALGLLGEITGGEVMGAPVIKGLQKGAGLVSKYIPKAKPIVDPLVKAMETTVDLTVGGKGFGSKPEGELKDFVDTAIAQDEAIKVAEATNLNNQIREALDTGKSSIDVMGTLGARKLLGTISTGLNKIDRTFNTNLTRNFQSLFEAKNLHMADHVKKTKYLKQLNKDYDALGISPEEAFDLVEAIGSEGVVKDAKAFSKFKNKDAVIAKTKEVRKYLENMADTVRIYRFNNIYSQVSDNIIKRVDDKVLQGKLQKNLERVVTKSTEDKKYFIKLNEDNQELLKELKVGLTKSEAKGIKTKLERVRKNNPTFKHIDNYIRYEAAEAPLVDALFKLSKKDLSREDALYKLLTENTASFMKKRGDVELLRKEKNLYKVLDSYTNQVSWHTKMKPELTKINKELFKLKNRELLNPNELEILKVKFGTFMEDVLNKGDLNRVHSEFMDLLGRSNFSGTELKYIKSFFDKNSKLFSRLENDAFKSGILDVKKAEALDTLSEYTEELYTNISSKGTTDPRLFSLLREEVKDLSEDLPDNLAKIGRRLSTATKNLNRGNAEEKLPDIFKLLEEFKSVSNIEGKKYYDLVTSITPGEAGKIEGEIGEALNKFFKGGKVEINTDASKFAEDWILRGMGYDNSLNSRDFGRGRILDLFEKISPNGSRVHQRALKYISDAIGSQIDNNATWADIGKAFQNYAYSNLIGWRTFNVIRNLTQPIIHTAPRLGVNPGQEFKAMTKAYAKLFDKNAWQEFRNAGLKSGRVVNEWDTQIKRILNRDKRFGNFLSKGGNKVQETGMFLFDTSDTVNRFISYHAGKEAAQSVLTKAGKGKTGAIKKLLRPVDLREQERRYLLDVLGDEGEEAFTEAFAKLVTNKTQFIYDALDRSPILKNNMMRLLFMFTKWPTEIAQRQGRYLKNILGKSADIGTRVDSGIRIGRDFLTTMALIELGREAGWDLSGLSPWSSLSVPNPSPYARVALGETDASEIATPIPAISKTLDRLGGNERFDALGIPRDTGKVPKFMEKSILYPLLKEEDNPFE